MFANSTTQIAALEAARDPMTVITIIGFVIGVISFLQSGLFTYSAVMGLGQPDGWVPPPEHWGKLERNLSVLHACVKSLTNLMNGSNDNGEYLGISRDKNMYARHNKGLALNIYPINVHRHEGQYATFAILEAKGDGRDPLCIVDMGLGRPNALDEEGSRAFGAVTAASCGAAWYHSGVYRKNNNGSTPCFWLGGYGTQGLQVHLPSHTVGQTHIPIEDINKTIDSAHDFFCNRPAVFSLWSELPERRKVPSLLVTDLDKRSGKTLNGTLELHKNKRSMRPGRPTLSSRSVPSPHEDTVTIAHELDGLSASELCEDALSRGPDYVNIPEGKFCRMSDKTLWPTCSHISKIGPRDDCFDVDSRQLVIGGKVTRSKPYNKEINYPL